MRCLVILRRAGAVNETPELCKRLKGTLSSMQYMETDLRKTQEAIISGESAMARGPARTPPPHRSVR